MKFNFFLKAFIACIIIILSASCDRDINEIGSGVIGDDHYGLNVFHSDVVAYNQSLGAVQTNDLPVNQFGFYNNPVFGKTKASFVTQLALATTNPTFYGNPYVTNPLDTMYIKMDSVYLYVPYYSTLKSTDSDGESTYELDSIQGSGKIKLSIYESTKTLEDNDPTSGFQQPQKYYSNQQSLFDTYNGGVKLNNDTKSVYDHTITDASQNDQFEFNKKQIKFYKKNADGTPGYTDVRERKAPGMLINLDTIFFRNKIFKAPIGKLFNNNVFKEYFKGLYFKAEAAVGSSSEGSLAMMNFSSGFIKIIYEEKTSKTVKTRVRREMTINLSGHTVNLLDNDNNFPGYVTPNTTLGDHNLFLKGGNGSMAVIDLFKGEKNSANSQLNTMRSEKWIINEANLTFYIDKDAMTGAPEPNRICLYDLTNKRPLIDLYTDITTSSITKFNKQIYGGILMDNNSKIVNKSIGERGTKYKIRLTNYIRTLVKNGGNTDITKDSTNVRLGLVVTENVTNATNSSLLSPFTTTSVVGSHQTKYVPTMSVVNPLGTILYGSNLPVTDPNYDKRLKLEIFYTKPE
jgi:hypothetical protein